MDMVPSKQNMGNVGDSKMLSYKGALNQPLNHESGKSVIKDRKGVPRISPFSEQNYGRAPHNFHKAKEGMEKQWSSKSKTQEVGGKGGGGHHKLDSGKGQATLAMNKKEVHRVSPEADFESSLEAGLQAAVEAGLKTSLQGIHTTGNVVDTRLMNEPVVNVENSTRLNDRVEEEPERGEEEVSKNGFELTEEGGEIDLDNDKMMDNNVDKDQNNDDVFLSANNETELMKELDMVDDLQDNIENEHSGEGCGESDLIEEGTSKDIKQGPRKRLFTTGHIVRGMSSKKRNAMVLASPRKRAQAKSGVRFGEGLYPKQGGGLGTSKEATKVYKD